jgi:hypothetical protein
MSTTSASSLTTTSHSTHHRRGMKKVTPDPFLELDTDGGSAPDMPLVAQQQEGEHGVRSDSLVADVGSQAPD